MPEVEQENAFIETFILSERRERYRLLLANPKRRSEQLGRLNHALDYIASLAQEIPSNRHNVEDVARLLHKRGMKDSDIVYIFSDVRELDGLHLPLRQALEKVLDAGFGSVVCCIKGRLAYYRPEAPANGYVLEKPTPRESNQNNSF